MKPNELKDDRQRAELAEERNRTLRRWLFHTVLAHGKPVRISYLNLIKYQEIDENLRFDYDQKTGDTILSAEYDRPVIDETELRRAMGVREIVRTYRVLFGEVWRALKWR
jgi:hypothetical protein